MIFRFVRLEGLVVVPAQIFGPDGTENYSANLAIDTGATRTVISEDIVRTLGYDLDALPASSSVVTGSGSISVRRPRLFRLETCGFHLSDLQVIAHSLPPLTLIDGLLGLDAFDGRKLTLDFRTNTLELS